MSGNVGAHMILMSPTIYRRINRGAVTIDVDAAEELAWWDKQVSVDEKKDGVMRRWCM